MQHSVGVSFGFYLTFPQCRCSTTFVLPWDCVSALTMPYRYHAGGVSALQVTKQPRKMCALPLPLSCCAYTKLPHYHITTLPHYHTTTLPHYITTLPHYHTTTLPHYHTTTLPHYHTTTLPHYHITTLPHYHTTTLPHYHTITLPHYHTTTLHYHTTTLPHYHTTTLPHYHTINSTRRCHCTPRKTRTRSCSQAKLPT